MLSPDKAHADDDDLEVGLSLDLGMMSGLDPESLDLGFGQSAALALLVRPHPVLSLTGGVQMFALHGGQPVAWFGSRLGARLHWGELFGFDPDTWIELSHIFGTSGAIASHGFEMGLGAVFPLFSAVYAGPSLRVQWMNDPDGTPVWTIFVGLSVTGWPGRSDHDAPEGWVSPARVPGYRAPTGMREAQRRRRRPGAAWILPDLELYGVYGVDDGRRANLGIGGGATAAVEVPIAPWLGVHGGVSGMVVSAELGDAAAWVGTRLGARFHWTALAELEGDGWIDVHHVYGVSASITTHGADVGIGYAADIFSFLRLGPMVRLTVLTDPGGDPALMLSFGVTVAVRGPRPGPGNIDGDEYLDRDDPCPTIQAGDVEDPMNPGCPLLDRDGDGIPDDQDLCDTEPAGEYPDPERPGCPLQDRDGDGVVDEIDFCPTLSVEEGEGDPLRDGCPEGVLP